MNDVEYVDFKSFFFLFLPKALNNWARALSFETSLFHVTYCSKQVGNPVMGTHTHTITAKEVAVTSFSHRTRPNLRYSFSQ